MFPIPSTKQIVTEHEKLKYICDTIGHIYTDGYWYDRVDNQFYKGSGAKMRRIDVREIIFTQDFREYLYDHLLLSKDEMRVKQIIEEMVWHLDNPVQYIYNLLELGKNI